jgi:hypothetical protein
MESTTYGSDADAATTAWRVLQRAGAHLIRNNIIVAPLYLVEQSSCLFAPGIQKKDVGIFTGHKAPRPTRSQRHYLYRAARRGLVATGRQVRLNCKPEQNTTLAFSTRWYARGSPYGDMAMNLPDINEIEHTMDGALQLTLWVRIASTDGKRGMSAH